MKQMQMNFPSLIETPRLILNSLNLNDNQFIFGLLNAEGWIKFIGDRNIASKEDAQTYIQKILDNKNIFYWIVKLKDPGEKIGLVTFIKRDYLSHHDIVLHFFQAFKNGICL